MSMLGYIQKYQKQHYCLESHNASPDELHEGQKFHKDVRVDSVDGRIVINMSNLIQHMYMFWSSYAPVL